MSRTPLVALALLLPWGIAACAAPPPVYVPADAPAPPARDGLTADQRDALRDLRLPVIVPSDPGAFELDRFEAGADATGASYILGYRRADGACLEVSGTTDGIGAPPFPIVSTRVRVPALGRSVTVYQAADDPLATSAQVWGVETVVSDVIDLDGLSALVLSDTHAGCRPVSIEDGAAFVATLAPLSSDGRGAAPPAGDDLGPFAPADDLLATTNAGSSPRLAAEAMARRMDAANTSVEMLAESTVEATALVTATMLRDDSVRHERLRLTYAPVGDVWELVAAGRQIRCQPGRGPQAWHDGRCT
ncbi:hypothetical protein [Rubrivirga sp. IMCC43871]|uniref:hypothetical protein n=1 Tax=Rubrivirga sp. IMCC43871 TaxID=3391575 RepID=UPI0039902E76